MSLTGFLPYTRAPEDLYTHIFLNAGIVVDGFDPSTGEYDNILGATVGGVDFSANPRILDLSQNMDDLPGGVKEFAYITGYQPRILFTMLEFSASNFGYLMAPAAADDNNDERFVPLSTITGSDFNDLWLIGDYGNANWGDDVGYMAIKLKNAFNIRGLRLKTRKNGLAQFAVEMKCYYSKDDPTGVPFEIYIHQGTPQPGSFVPPTPGGDAHSPRSTGTSAYQNIVYFPDGPSWEGTAQEEVLE